MKRTMIAILAIIISSIVVLLKVKYNSSTVITTNIEEDKIVGIEQEIEEYRIDNIVSNGGVVEINYLYDINRVSELMREMGKEEFVRILKDWNYSDDPTLSSPIDTIQGESNCRGITLFIAEWLLKNTSNKEVNYHVSIGTSHNNNLDHMYLKIKPTGQELQVWDMSIDKESSIIMIINFIDEYY